MATIYIYDAIGNVTLCIGGGIVPVTLETMHFLFTEETSNSLDSAILAPGSRHGFCVQRLQGTHMFWSKLWFLNRQARHLNHGAGMPSMMAR
jgi:hypothetical protein